MSNVKLTAKEIKRVVDGKDNLLSSSIVIERINTKRSTFEKWVRSGFFPAPKTYINGYPRWLTSQLLKWLKDQAVVTA